MNLNSEPITKAGQFCVGSHQNLRGELSLQGLNSVLHIKHIKTNNEEFFKPEFPSQDITGILDGQEKAFLIKCIRVQFSRSERSCKFLPCYIIVGDHLHEPDKVIEEVLFVVDDAYALFGNQNSSGNLEIFSAEINESTEKISAYIPTINNQKSKDIWIKLQFKNPLEIKEVDEKIDSILRFLGIIAGRPQNILEVKIKIKDNPRQLPLYLNAWSSRVESLENPKPFPCDVLISAANQREKFETLISKWLERDEDDAWRIARQVFSEVWNKQRKYDFYRIIAAVIMFEVLPQEVFPPQETKMSGDFESIIQEVEKLVRCRLSNTELSTIEKNLVLNPLRNCHKNLNRLTLKRKAKLRLELITEKIENSEIECNLSQLDCVIDKAIDLRNFYIHGDNDRSGESRKRLTKYLPFLTKTLGFIFCVSDLMDLEWDFLLWYKKYKTTCHPFSAYICKYQENLQEFKEIFDC